MLSAARQCSVEFTHSLTHSWSSTFLRSCQLCSHSEISSILWNPKVYYRVQRALHWSLSWARLIQSVPSHPISLTSILILSTHLRLGLLSSTPCSQTHHVRWVPCHHGMARPQVADGGDALQVWWVAANILNKQSRTADKGWSSSMGIGRGATAPHRKIHKLVTKPNMKRRIVGW
jgi:hypothetical protein